MKYFDLETKKFVDEDKIPYEERQEHFTDEELIESMPSELGLKRLDDEVYLKYDTIEKLLSLHVSFNDAVKSNIKFDIEMEAYKRLFVDFTTSRLKDVMKSNRDKTV